jgi:hypothetical protein
MPDWLTLSKLRLDLQARRPNIRLQPTAAGGIMSAAAEAAR